MQSLTDMEPDLSPEDLYFPPSFEGFTPQAKLAHAKQLYERQEAEIFKLRADLKRSEALVKKLQETVALQSQNQNNTSSCFTLPSEFKQSWEDLQGELMDTFEDFFEQHWLLAWLVKDLTELVYTQVLQDLDQRLTALTGLFMLDGSQKERIRKTFLRLFQDNCGKMLAMTEAQFSQLRLSFERKAKAYIPADQWDSLVTTVEQSSFRTFIEHWLKLCLHMVFSEPRLSLTYPDLLDYSVLTKPEDVFVIDGFPKGSPLCVVVLPPPFRSGAPYQGLKPAVLILNPSQAKLSDEEQCRLRAEREESIEPSSPLAPEPRKSDSAAPLEVQPTSEDESPGISTSFRKSRPGYTQKYEQKLTMTRSPYTRKEASSKETLALYHHLKNLKQYESKARAGNRLAEEEDQTPSRYSTMPLQVRKSPFVRADKVVKPLNILNISDAGPLQKSSRKSFDETPSSTQRLRKEGICPGCRSKLPCHRCEGARAFVTEAYSKPVRAHSSSVLEEKDEGGKTTSMKKKVETAKRAIRQNESLRAKEACKVM